MLADCQRIPISVSVNTLAGVYGAVRFTIVSQNARQALVKSAEIRFVNPWAVRSLVSALCKRFDLPPLGIPVHFLDG